MKKELTPQQIDHLHEFCEKHYVPYYDLQVELVDHLASSIESRWENQLEISFEQALYDTYREFGVTGFSRVRMSREKELLKKYRRMLWQYVGQFFKLPKIILTIALSALLFILFRSTEKDSVIVVSFIVMVALFEIAYFVYIYPRFFSINAFSKNKFLLGNVFRNIQGMFATVPLLLLNFASFLNMSDYPSFLVWFELFVSVFMIALSFFIISLSFYVPGKIRAHFEEQFPQFAKA
ncbi:MAG: hypothetical protein PF486_11875 [Prolixibacteraceae bacterium]|jgi:hypothetical protein|nr:hypothetical protein [Prolixibacteraceae bacterium]